jgi:hypothetical protein
MTKTRTVDNKGNITWHFSIDGTEVGTARGFGGGWWVEETGREGGITKKSVKAAAEVIEFWRRCRGL